jgi:hypothetical protein
MNRPRRLALALASASALASTLALADFDFSMWKVRRSVGPSPQGGVVGFTIPPDLYKAARADLADLRLVGEDGTEVPFDIWTDPPSEHVTQVPAELQKTKRGEEFRLVVFDTGETPVTHSRITIKTLTKNFRRPVNVEASRTTEFWENLRVGAFLWSEVEGGRTVERLSVDYPTATHRYVRLAQPPEDELLAGVEATLENVTRHEGGVDVVYDGSARSREDAQTKETAVSVDLGGPVPHTRLELVTTEPRLHRWATAEESSDESTWQFLGAEEIDRRATSALASGPAEGDMSIEFPEKMARYVRVRVHNYTENPIPFSGMKVYALRREVRFQAEANKPYWLYYGNEEAGSRAFTPKVAEGTTAIPAGGVIAIGREEPSPTYGVEPGLFDRIPPFLIFGAVGAIVLLLLLVVVVVAKRKKGPRPPKPPRDPDLDIKF